jgi:hypothetical protein
MVKKMVYQEVIKEMGEDIQEELFSVKIHGKH